MKYFKKVREDKTVELIGTSETVSSDCSEITEEEYNSLYDEIKKNVVHITVIENYEEEIL